MVPDSLRFTQYPGRYGVVDVLFSYSLTALCTKYPLYMLSGRFGDVSAWSSFRGTRWRRRANLISYSDVGQMRLPTGTNCFSLALIHPELLAEKNATSFSAAPSFVLAPRTPNVYITHSPLFLGVSSFGGRSLPP